MLLEMNEKISNFNQLASEIEEDLSKTEDKPFRDSFGEVDSLFEDINLNRVDKDAQELIGHARLSTKYREILTTDKENFLRFFSSLIHVRRWGKDQRKFFQENRKFITKDGDPERENFMKASLGTLEPSKLEHPRDALKFYHWLTEWDNYVVAVVGLLLL